MVQEFNVLRCFSCKRFQVHQVKKAKNLVCKVCGEKQSIAKIYGQGSAPDCRRHVQKLNRIQGEREQLIAEKAIYDDEEYGCYENEVVGIEESPQEACCDERDPVGSKWEKFVQVENKGEEDRGEELWNGRPVTTDRTALESGKKNIKQQGNKNKNNKHYEEFTPAKKRKTRNFENYEDKDEFDRENFSKRRESQKETEKRWEETGNSKWEIFNPRAEERPKDENMLMNHTNNRAASKWNKFATLETASMNYDSLRNQAPVDKRKLDARSRPNGRQEDTCNSKINSQDKEILSANNTKTSQSKWLKFLGSSSCTNAEHEVEGEEDNFDDSNFDTCENNLVKCLSPIPKRLGCNRKVDSNSSTLDSTFNVNNPSFLLNVKATSSKHKTDNFIDKSSQSNQQTRSVISKDLFTIDDELDGDWWSV